MTTKSFYWCLSFFYLTISTVSPYYQTEYFYNILTQDKTFFDTDIITLPNVRVKRLAELKNDSHIYYNSSIISNIKIFNDYWVDLENHPDANILEKLLDSHRRAATINLKFQFPFYGHLLNSTTIATGGFLYLGEYIHSRLAATQFIAPLMANFDLSSSIHSKIYYMENGTALTVTWHNVTLQDNPEVGGFTFQTTLHSNGNIVFAYKNVPTKIEEIDSTNHPVKIGLSDAYVLDKTTFFIRKKTVYEYHRVLFHEDEDVTNGTVIILTALPTCLEKKNCTSCFKKDTDIQCFWCDNLCSSGVDRNRQDWIQKDCDKFKTDNEDMCTPGVTTITPPVVHNSSVESSLKSEDHSQKYLTTTTIIMTTKSFYWCLSFVYLTISTVSPYQTEYFYNILTQDKTFFDTDIITLPNVRVKRLAEFKNDSHIYYNSSIISNIKIFNDYWVDLENHPDANILEKLLDSHRRAATINLKFQFPFYGHLLNSTTIATGGFLYLGEYIHSRLAATQFIAPLMANFDLSSSIHSKIYYMENGTALTVTWHNVTLQDNPEVGGFTFQTTLHSNGNIVFAYKNVPTKIEEIDSTNHPVKIGLSDAYVLDKTTFFIRKKTVYEYHRVLFHEDEDVTNGTVIILTALPTCLEKKNCTSCFKKDTDIQCFWCDNLCSSGVDRNRQDWIQKDCDKFKTDNEDMCTPGVTTITPPVVHNSSVESSLKSEDHSQKYLTTTTIIMTTKSFYWCLSFVYLTISTVSPYQTEYFYNILTQDKTFFDTDIITLPNVRVKRLAEFKNDSHIYYNSSIISNIKIFNDYWVDLENHPDANIHEKLSDSHRGAETINLKFQFPFYGHLLNSTTIATGGFLYLGEYIHSWLAATQYIAPLMANFDLGSSNHSKIYYMENGTALTVTWHNVTLQDKPKVGGFTFQTTLHSNGNIVFAYKNVPTKIEEIDSTNHPVKIGLSDAYVLDKTTFFIRKKTVYEYHRVLFHKDEDVTNGTVIILTALSTCLEKKNCTSCFKKDTDIQCFWCDNLCSSGVDRKRQDWIQKDCEKFKIDNEDMCTPEVTTITPPVVHNSSVESSLKSEDHTNSSSSGIRLFFITSSISSLLMSLAWICYAYLNPNTRSGQLLIKYRPNHWGWGNGETTVNIDM